MPGTVFVTVDSRDKESPAYTPGSYTVRLVEDVKEVCGIRLRSCTPATSLPSRTCLSGGRPCGSSDPAETSPKPKSPGDHDEASARDALLAALGEAAPDLAWEAEFRRGKRLSNKKDI